jgi:hypothetical protein
MQNIVFDKNMAEPTVGSEQNYRLMYEMKLLFETEGLEVIIRTNPDLEVLEITGYENVVIPDNIGTLENLQNLTIQGASNLPGSIVNCKKLELVSFKKSQGTFDVGIMNEIPTLSVLNVFEAPHITGTEKLGFPNVLVVTD